MSRHTFLRRARVAAATLLLAFAGAASAAGQVTVITAARMVDVLTGKVVEYPAVFVEDGRITQVADSRVIRWGANVKHIDLGARTLLPGLIDMHVHLTSLAEIGGYQTFKHTDSFWSAVGVANAAKTLNAGFTTVRNVGAADFQDVGLKEAVDGGWIPGPRIVPATWAIGATGGHCDDNSLPPSYDKKGPSTVDSPAEARARVRWLHKYGAEVIKI